MEFSEYRNIVLKSGEKRKVKVNNSWGIYDAYKAIRKGGWEGIGRPLTEHEFYSIIRGVNNLLAEELGKGNSVILPSRMGILELRKYKPTAKFSNGKLKVTYPVDWDKTLRLWFTDKEARDSKILVRMEENNVYRIKYNKYNANYENSSFYEFSLNSKIKKMLKENIKAGKADTAYE